MDVAHISVLRRKIEEVRNKRPAQPQEVVVAPISVLRQRLEEAAGGNENRQSQPAQPDVESEEEEETQSSSDGDLPLDEVAEESDPSLKVSKILKLEHVWSIKYNYLILPSGLP